MLDKIKSEIVQKAHAKLKSSADVLIKQYLRALSINQIQLTYRKLGAGRNRAVKPSGTNQSRSRLPRVMVPGKGLVAAARCSTVGGPRAYHDRTVKRIITLPKKIKKLAIHQLILKSLIYSNTYVINRIDLQNRANILDEIFKVVGPKRNQRVNRAMRKYAKVAVLVHNSNGVYTKYKNTQIDTIDLRNPCYKELALQDNSKHIIIYTKESLKEITDVL